LVFSHNLLGAGAQDQKKLGAGEKIERWRSFCNERIYERGSKKGGTLAASEKSGFWEKWVIFRLIRILLIYQACRETLVPIEAERYFIPHFQGLRKN